MEKKKKKHDSEKTWLGFQLFHVRLLSSIFIIIEKKKNFTWEEKI